MPEVLLEVRALACRRGERLLFEGLDLQILPGQVVWLRGPNGCGKTSLLRIVAGLSPPAQGRLYWQGQAVADRRREFQGTLVYIAHANALKEDLTATESLAFLARLHGRKADGATLTAALRGMGLHSRRHAPVRTLSQGQRRRVALARLLIEPLARLWVLDEPHDALDAEGSALLDGLLSDHAARGGGVLLTSHIPLALQTPLPAIVDLDRNRPVSK